MVKTLMNKLSEVTLEWCLASTAHAIPKAARTRNLFIRLLWLSCFGASALYCLYAIVLSTKSYMSNQTYISTQIVQETSTYFPAVTFCSLKMLNKIRSAEYIEAILDAGFRFNESEHSKNVQYWLYGLQYVIKGYLNSNYSSITTELRDSMGFNISEILLTCVFNWKPCGIEAFTHSFHPLYGNCYTFNGPNENATTLKKVRVPGGDYGLVLDLFLGNPHVQTEYEFSDGVIVVVNNQSTIPLLNSERVLVSTGAETDLKIQRTFVSKLSSPYSNCRPTQETPSNSLQQCYLLCLQKLIYDECNCSVALLPMLYKSGAACLLPSEQSCFSEIVRGFKNTIEYDKCIHECPNECDFIEYKVSTSRATFPSVFYKKMLQRDPIINASGIPPEDIDKSVLRMNVFYESMSYTLVTEVPLMSSQVFFSNIGGTLGLCLGVSILSGFEILELFMKLIEIMMKHKKKVEEGTCN